MTRHGDVSHCVNGDATPLNLSRHCFVNVNEKERERGGGGLSV